MGAVDYTPTRKGYRLTEEGEQAYQGWLDDYYNNGGCTCFRSAPCGICHHEGHPYGVEETDEYWEWDDNLFGWQKGFNDVIYDWFALGWTIDDLVKEGLIWYKEEDVSRKEIVDKSEGQKPRRKFESGDKVRITGNSNTHKYKLGDIVTLVGDRDDLGGGFFWETNDKQGFSCVRECDMEPYSETEVFKSGDRIKISDRSRGDFGNEYILDTRFPYPSGKYYWTFKGVHRSCPEEHMELVVEGSSATGLEQPVITGKIDLSSHLHVGATDNKKGHTLVDTEWVQYARMALDGYEASKLYREICDSRDLDDIIAYRDNVHQTTEGSAKRFISFTPIFKQTKEEINMSTQRRVVNVILIDEDAGLDVSNSLVKDFGQVVTEDDNSVMIQELIMDNDMKAILTKHNDKRAQTVDKDIQNRTGKKVMLQPVKLKNLKWIVK